VRKREWSWKFQTWEVLGGAPDWWYPGKPVEDLPFFGGGEINDCR
jgi:hypothetical protein